MSKNQMIATPGEMELLLPDLVNRTLSANDRVKYLLTLLQSEDLVGMVVAAGLLTATGGRTSHAAVVAREMAVPCVAGAAGIEIDLARRHVSIGGREFAEGDRISIDGELGRVFADTIQIDDERPTANLAAIVGWPATNGIA